VKVHNQRITGRLIETLKWYIYLIFYFQVPKVTAISDFLVNEALPLATCLVLV